MKNLVLTVAFSLAFGTIFSQTNKNPQLIKYITNGPDGTAVITLYDDSREDNMKLESAEAFYKYQILDPNTSEPIYTADNKGKECTIDKTSVVAGNYKLRLFTSDFVITSNITVSASRKFVTAISTVTVAIND